MPHQLFRLSAKDGVRDALYDPEARAKSHQFLSDYLAENPGSPAECRCPEDDVFEVWDGPEPPRPEVPGKTPLDLDDAALDRLADRLIAKLSKKAGGG